MIVLRINIHENHFITKEAKERRREYRVLRINVHENHFIPTCKVEVPLSQVRILELICASITLISRNYSVEIEKTLLISLILTRFFYISQLIVA